MENLFFSAQGTELQDRRLSPRKRFVFVGASCAISIVLVSITAEVAARLTGIRPFQVRVANISVEPGGRFFAADPQLGYTHIPGVFKVTLDGAYNFRTTNLPDSLRATHPISPGPPPDRPAIWIFGDSVTYGWSVNDEESYPWILQGRLPAYEILNFGVSGYGPLHSLIQLRTAVKTRPKPICVVLAYASWQDVRNTFTRSRQKLLVPSAHLGPLTQPYARLRPDGGLETFMAPITYREFPLMRHSAFMHFLEERYDAFEERRAHSHEVTKAIIKQIWEVCNANGIDLAVVGLTSDATTADMLEYCQSINVKTTSIWVDLSIKQNNNLPYDSHPSALAQEQYAEKLESFIRLQLLNSVSTTSILSGRK